MSKTKIPEDKREEDKDRTQGFGQYFTDWPAEDVKEIEESDWKELVSVTGNPFESYGEFIVTYWFDKKKKNNE